MNCAKDKEKCVVIVFGRDKNIEKGIVLNREPLMLVENFTYLVSEISANGRINVEISKS